MFKSVVEEEKEKIDKEKEKGEKIRGNRQRSISSSEEKG